MLIDVGHRQASALMSLLLGALAACGVAEVNSASNLLSFGVPTTSARAELTSNFLSQICDGKVELLAASFQKKGEAWKNSSAVSPTGKASTADVLPTGSDIFKSQVCPGIAWADQAYIDKFQVSGHIDASRAATARIKDFDPNQSGEGVYGVFGKVFHWRGGFRPRL